MAREIAISIYLTIFKLIFKACKLFPQKDKTTLVASFGDNVFYVAEALNRFMPGHQIVILKKANCRINFSRMKQDGTTILNFETINLYHFIVGIYHLATSKFVFVDNYLGFLAVTDFRKNVKCVQLWHAAGAIKRFGLKDPTIAGRSPRAIARFKQVYRRFDHVVVGSSKMADVFHQSFGVKDKQILRTGVPRTDFFYDKAIHPHVIEGLEAMYPIIQGKKVILYSPTFRDGQLDSCEIALDVRKLYEELGDEYVLMLRLHPALKCRYKNKYPGLIIDVTRYKNINHLLLITDYLITDYSSIPVEFSLMEKPMIFFSYDLEEYERTRGFWEDYESGVPGPIARSTDEIVQLLLAGDFDLDLVRDYSMAWNEYSCGRSSERLVEKVYGDWEML